jgi:dihydroxyacetone kinase-like protein
MNMTDATLPGPMLKALRTLCDTIEQEKDALSQLDGAIGDGDHGVNMAKCFREVRKKLSECEGLDFGSLFRQVGMVVMNSVGGAMGALYGTFFLRLAQSSSGKTRLNLDDWGQMLRAAEKGILEIGKARAGDKTLLDTLMPAVQALENAQRNGKPLPEALQDFQAAAEQGMLSTRDMIARAGRASRLGERTLGHQDAGATSCYFILRALAQSAQTT